MRPTEGNRRWWILLGSGCALFVLMLDSTIVNLAVPSIQGELDASNSELRWVISAYLLTLSVLVVTLARMGDLFGRRRVFLFGIVAFTAGSVVAATAADPLQLIVGRALQGVGAAAMLALSLAIVTNAFPPAEQARAIGIWTGISALALGLGPLAGAVIVSNLSWRWVFWLPLPFLVAGILITAIATPESRDETAVHRIDLPGLLTLSAGLIALMLALIEGKDWGWSSTPTLAVGVVAVLSLGAFVAIEHRVDNPIVDFPLFRNGPYFGATAAAFGLVGCYWSVLFFQPQYLQEILGNSVIASGLLVLPITLPTIVISPLTGRLMQRVGARPLMTAGMALATAGLAIQTQLGPRADYLALMVSFTLFGVAIGVVYAPMSSAAMAAMPRQKAGIASGVLAMNRVLAGALGLAVTGALFQHLQRDRVSELLAARVGGLRRGDRDELDGLLAGSHEARRALVHEPLATAHAVEQAVRETFAYALANSTWVLVGLAAVATAFTAAMVRSAPTQAPEPHPPEHHRRLHL
ncbi:MAG: MFS transporter [Actinobacteria bacterium]|nr:MAG: MFS transporter [Actinomycetota bacterium]